MLSPFLFNLYPEYIIQNARLDESQIGIKIAGRNISNLRYAYDSTLMAERGTNEPLDEGESKKGGLKLSIQKTDHGICPVTLWQIEGEKVEAVADLIFLGSKIIVDGDCSREIERCSLEGKL